MDDLMGLMKQAKKLQEKVQGLQEEIAAMEVSGTSGGGLVTAIVDGKGRLKSIKVDPSLAKADEIEILEDLIVAAANDAGGKAEAAAQEKMQEATVGLPLPPGVTLPI